VTNITFNEVDQPLIMDVIEVRMCISMVEGYRYVFLYMIQERIKKSINYLDLHAFCICEYPNSAHSSGVTTLQITYGWKY